MKDKVIYLAIFIDKYNVNNHFFVLNKFASVQDLDSFTIKFTNYEELRKYYEVDISEYLMDNQKIIKNNETKNKNFKGRISAFYYNSRGEMEFLEIKYQKRKIVRDYKEFSNQSDAISFMKKVFDVSLEKLNEKRLLKKDVVYYFANILENYHYHISEEEKKYLYNYLNTRSNHDYQDLIKIMKKNVKRAYMRKESEILDTILENHIHEVTLDDDAPDFLKYNINNDEKLFLHYDIDEIDKYTDRFRR